MALMDPYLGPRYRVCYGNAMCEAPPCPGCPNPELNPNCHYPDFYKRNFYERWKKLRQNNPCDRTKDPPPKAGCDFLKELKNSPKTINTIPMCSTLMYDEGKSVYTKDYKYPVSPENYDDCCPADCHCSPDGFPQIPNNLTYRCWMPEKPCAPLESMTSYRYWYTPKEVPPPPQRKIGEWDPCECPMQDATTTRIEYGPKKCIPNGPADAAILKHGLWSADQFSKDFTDSTTTGEEYVEKSAYRPPAFTPVNNLRCGCGPMNDETETNVEYTPKELETVCYPPWLENEIWLAPITPMDRCTTYKHYYRPHPIPHTLVDEKVETPNAIPFCTTDDLCYDCTEPCVDQRPPVEMKDNDPWPYVKPCPIRYQDNLYTDPCAPFRDHTTYKESYYAKRRCVPTENGGPLPVYAPSLQPFNDDTINRLSYPAYTRCEYENAKGNAGNPNGIYWGTFICPPNEDKCLPRFAVPYGNPLKPYTGRCPCGTFDDRPTYKRDFRFKTCQMIADMERELCCSPVGTHNESLYRQSYVNQGGKRAAVMPPPTGKGYRCMNPCSIRETDSLYRIDYSDFWKKLSRENLELYRGKPTIRVRRPAEQPRTKLATDADEGGVIYQPVHIGPSNNHCQQSEEENSCPTWNCSPIPRITDRRCRRHAFDGGQTILNIPKFPDNNNKVAFGNGEHFGIRDGHAGTKD